MINFKDKRFIIAAVAIACVSAGLGILIGSFIPKSKTVINNSYYEKLIEEFDDQLGVKLITENLNEQNIKKHLKYLTSIPHMAGTPGDKLSADYIYNEWKAQGLDSIQMIDYDVFLSFPDDNKFNNVEILNSQQQVESHFDIDEKTYDSDLDYKGIPKPFLAYAPSGSVLSDEIYFVNYCREEDFEVLIRKGYDLTNKLVMCRYGKIFRGNKVEFAQHYNASGVLIYDDPKRVAPQVALNHIYPSGEFLPNDGVQRGSIIVRDGDPSTPHYPANEYAHHLTEKEMDFLPKIPAQCIGYSVAYQIFKLMLRNQNPVEEDWRGDFNITYTYGGKLDSDRLLRLNVYNSRRVEKTYNVIGIIEGSMEPDRYVMIGNHRDAWSYGALDPTSGTSVMLEISRTLAYMKQNKNWRPKRSIMFLSWGAEEYALIGSVEWVEEFQKKLSLNSVLYVNLDTIIKGNYSYKAYSSPLLFEFIFDTSKAIRFSNGETVYERWMKNDPNADNTAPKITADLGSGSDYMSFVQTAGVPCIDHAMYRDKKNPFYLNLESGSYPTYHSSYETFNLINKYLDPNFEAFKMIGIISSELLRRMADRLILPFNCVHYANELIKEYRDFEETYGKDLDQLNIGLNYFKAAVYNFSMNANEFHKRLNAIDREKFHLIRAFNDQLRNVERSFLDASGLKRLGYQHMVYSPSIADSYGSDTFPSITDAIYNYKKNPQSKEFLEEIRIQLAIVTFSIQSASSVLKEPLNFERYVY